MKYLKTYESFFTKTKKFLGMERSLLDFLNEEFAPYSWYGIKEIFCPRQRLTNLNGIENLTMLEDLACSHNKLTSLKGIENCKNLKKLYCVGNKLTNIDEIKNLPKLKELYVNGDSFELPVPIEIVNKFGKENVYNIKEEKFDFYSGDEPIYYYTKMAIRFKSYEFQKKFLTEHPDRFEDLVPFDYAKGIKEEFPALFRGKEWGFFDLNDS